MKRVMIVYEISDERWESVCAELQDLLDDPDPTIGVTEYRIYEEDEQYPDIIKRKEI